MDKNTERKEVTFEVVDGLKMKKNKSYPLTRTSSAKMPHIVIGLLSDEKATQYLNEGLISEKHFKKLPENYLKAKKVKEAKEKEANKVKK